MKSRNDRQHPAERVAAGVKTALFVCVIGFIALMANRSLVAPGGTAPVEASPAPSIIAPDVRTPTLVPADEDAMASLRAKAQDDASAQYDGADNHPPSF